MSTSVDQRMKGQGSSVSNGPKDMVKDEEFESWRNQPHQTYNPPMSSSSMPDPYMPSYYASMSFPYLNQGLGDGAWSNGGDPMTFLGGYGGQMGSGEQHSHYMDGMFGQNSFGGYNQGFNFFPGGGGGDYSTWGNSTMGTRKTGHGAYHDDYYRDTYDQGMDRNALKHMEQGMGGLSLTDHKNESQFVKDPYGKPGMLPSNLMTDHQLAKKFGAAASDPMVMAGAPGVAGQAVGSKKMTWASVASQPAKPQPKIKPKTIPPAPMLSGKHNAPSMDIGTWESKNGNGTGNGTSGGGKMGPPPPPPQSRSAPWGAPRGNRSNGPSGPGYNSPPQQQQQQQQITIAQNPSAGGDNYPQHPVLDKLRMENNYNPKDFDMSPKNARFFIIKSYSEDDIHRSIKYSIWCSTEHGNKRLDQAYRERDGKGVVYLFYSVNGSGHFCGMAQMVSPVDYNCSASVWAQDKWKGQFKVKWIYVKDVPNSQLRHIRLENNENKPVTNSRDTQEVPAEKGKQVLKIIHSFRHTTSIFDDFLHYEKRQEEDEQRKTQMDRREVMEKHRKQWNSLSDDKTVKWIRKAFQDEHRYGTEVEKYRSDHPDFHPDPVKTVLSKAEKELKDRYDGKPERPPNSGYSLFSRIMLRQLTDFPSRAKMAEISRRWKQLSELDREAYNKKIQKANAIYKEKYAAFLNSLPEKERQKIESDAKVSNKKRAVNHTTVDNTKNDISELEAIDGALPAMIYFQQEKYVVFRQRHPKQDVMKMLAREYNELSEKKKEKYKKIAEEAKMAYDEVSTTKGKESGGDASGGTRGGGGGGRKQLFKGEPRKPPQSGYGLFSTEMLSVLTNVDPKHRMSEIAKRWKAMTNAEKEKYKKKVQDLMRKYNRNMQKFITSLSAAEFQEYEKHRKSNIKSKSKKQIKPEQPKFQMDPRIS